MVQVSFDLVVQSRDHDDSPLWRPIDQTSEAEEMVLDDLGVQRVSTDFTFFKSVVEDIRNMVVGFKSHY